uniref:Protein phosphatase 1 regulatory subunit 22 n=1 Tax=Ciona savignyi TaxID=51511 RepID=H2ZBF7_CIOSA
MQCENIFHIDEDLENISNLNLDANVKSLSLHSNRIQHLDGIESASHLKSLDVSSNQLTSMAGLERMHTLRSLNLASNSLTTICLTGLRSLVELNLSYNKIESLEAFAELQAYGSALEVLLLHGNRIAGAQAVVDNLKGIFTLKHLVLQMEGEGVGNPLCQEKDYRTKILNGIHYLTSLDHVDRSGSQCIPDVCVLNFDSDLEDLLESSVNISCALYGFCCIWLNVVLLNNVKLGYTQYLNTPQVDALIQENQPTHQQQKQPPPTINHSSSTREALSTPRIDQFLHQILKVTFTQHLLKELENEREQRWKAEQANNKLVLAVNEMRSAQLEGKSLQNLANQATERLKKSLIGEKEVNQELKSNIETLKNEVETLKEMLESSHSTIGEQKRVIHKNQNSLSKLKNDIATVSNTQSRKVQALQAKASHLRNESDGKTIALKQLEQRINDLQGVILSKEESFAKAMDGKFSIDSLEFQRLVADRVAQEDKRHQVNAAHLESRIASLQQDYLHLENEFREALHIESERYNEVQVNSLEGALEKEREKVTQLEQIKRDKLKLLSNNVALQSLIDGLREERKVWGEELAQQGSSLAQDRGRLEMKVESLNAEIVSLKKSNERDLDLLRIKSKVVDDQTDTILKMKEALVEKDKEVRAKLDEDLQHHRRLEQHIEDLTQDNAALKEQNDYLLERKKQLKTHIAQLEQEQSTLQDDHQRLKKKWSEKSDLLSKLEVQVKNLSVAAKQRENKLQLEKEEALASKSSMEDRMARMDSTFQEQLDAIRVSHEQQMNVVQNQHQSELERCQKKIHSTEEEMREILRDAEMQKKSMQNKLMHIKDNFHE